MNRKHLDPLIPALWVIGNLSPIVLYWLLWPRLDPAKVPSGDSANILTHDFFVAMIFPLQHSIWTQTSVKSFLKRRFTEFFERPLYVVSSGIAILITVWLWRSSPVAVWRAPMPVLWVLRVVLIAAVVGQIYSATALGAKFMIGIAHIKVYMKGKSMRPVDFKIAGLYKWVRHPIAACQIAAVWCSGLLFQDLLLLAIVWTIWIIIATALEDIRLENEFGETYRKYRTQAGFLWPRFATK